MSTATLDLALCLEEQARRQARRQLDRLFPDAGPLRRDLYARSLEFFAAGKTHRLRLLLGGNRTSKSVSGCYEDTVHLTGQYPAWWPGRRFDHPIKAWVCGTSDEKIKESVQQVLLGEVGAWGTGLLPGNAILGIEKAASPIKDLVDTVRVEHTHGGASLLQFKSYKQGRKAFEASFVDLIHDDEEVPLDIHTEQLLRTMDTTGTGTRDGCLYVTFTPLEGLSETVLEYLPSGELPEGPQPGEKHVTLVGWDDVPHLSEASKASLRAAIPAYQLDARTRGIPMLGAGAIYPVPEEAYLVDDFPLPPHWERAYGLDVGWNRTAAVWGAYDREADRWTLYYEHYVGQQEPSLHARAIQAPGAWIPGCIDPGARGRSQNDGEQLLQDYNDLGLHLDVADNTVEAPLYQIWERMTTGRLKVFKSLSNWRSEVKRYHRDTKGHIIKKDDHCLHGDTRVQTAQGLMPLASLVGTTVRVLTTGGVWADAYGARCTATNVPVIRLAFDDGSAVICTPDHQFLTPHGWREAQEMPGHICYNAVSQRIQWRHRWSCRSFPPRFRNFRASVTGSVASIFSAMASVYTAWCGPSRTAALCPMGIMSTMTTATATTTSQTISSASQGADISRRTWSSSAGSFRPPPGKQPSSGMPVQRGMRGITSTIPTRLTSSISVARSCVRTVARLLRRRSLDRTASVPTIARPNGAVLLAWTMRNALVSSAAQLFWRIATRRNKPARAAAGAVCLAITDAGHSDVYCLTVPGAQAFAIEQGLIAHNCMDAMRYLISSGRAIAQPVPVAKAPAEPRHGGAHGWMA